MTPASLEFSPIAATLYALSIYAFMALLAYPLLRYEALGREITSASSRYGSIDGLRGLLAVGVFVHHSFTAWGYFATGDWRWSSSALLNHLGQTTVAMFFMITGFLFTIKASAPQIDWKRLYIGRIARLLPLYAVVVCVLFSIVFVLSGGQLREPPLLIAKEFIQWLTFVCFGRPDVNAQPMTWTMIAGVNWSLKYEVIFYLFGVPAIYLIIRASSVGSLLGLSFVSLTALLVVQAHSGSLDGHRLYAGHFLCGILIASMYLIPDARKIIQGSWIRYLAILSTVLLFQMTDASNSMSVLLTAVIFSSIVGGGSIFGLLRTRGAMWLGDISYGIYLVHGLVLWIALSAFRELADPAGLPLMPFWAIVLSLSFLVLLLSSLSYVYLEKPMMRYATTKSRAAASTR